VIGSVDTSADTVVFSYPLTTGDVVTYDRPTGGTAIGLADDREYQVINAGTDKIQFGSLFNAATNVNSS
jgi:hypothetical protein